MLYTVCLSPRTRDRYDQLSTTRSKLLIVSTCALHNPGGMWIFPAQYSELFAITLWPGIPSTTIIRAAIADHRAKGCPHECQWTLALREGVVFAYADDDIDKRRPIIDLQERK